MKVMCKSGISPVNDPAVDLFGVVLLMAVSCFVGLCTRLISTMPVTLVKLKFNHLLTNFYGSFTTWKEQLHKCSFTCPALTELVFDELLTLILGDKLSLHCMRGKRKNYPKIPKSIVILPI